MPWLTVKALKYEVDSLFRLHWQWTFFSVLQVSIAATVQKPQSSSGVNLCGSGHALAHRFKQACLYTFSHSLQLHTNRFVWRFK